MSIDPEPNNRFVSYVTAIMGLGGLFVTVFVSFASLLQYRLDPDQYLITSDGGIIITAGLYFRLLAITYFLISLASLLSVYLLNNQRVRTVGRWLMLEIYTIGIIRSIFAIFFEDRYGLFGKLLMVGLIVFGIAMLLIVNRHHSKKNHVVIVLQILVGVLLFIVVPIQILELVPQLIID